MRVGMTYDLRDDYLAMGYSEEQTAEFDRPDTLDAIEAELARLGHDVERIGHVQQLVPRLARGGRWDLVFNIAEGMYGVAREAQVPALLDAYRIPYTFSDPMVLALTLHKGMTKHVIRSLGLPTPDFAVVEAPAEAERVNLPFPLFCKPVAEGTGKGITAASRVSTRGELVAVCALLLAEFQQPVLVETYLPGREVTVGVTGTGDKAECVGAMEVILGVKAESAAYTYENKEHYEDRVTYEKAGGLLLREASDLALAAWRGLGCRDGGRIDLRADAAGRLNFLEVNPLAGLHPVRSDLPILARMFGVSYGDLIARMVASAMERIPQDGSPAQPSPRPALTAV